MLDTLVAILKIVGILFLMYLIAGAAKIILLLALGWTFRIIVAVINFVHSLFTGKPLLDMSLTGNGLYEAKQSNTPTKWIK